MQALSALDFEAKLYWKDSTIWWGVQNYALFTKWSKHTLVGFFKS